MEIEENGEDKFEPELGHDLFYVYRFSVSGIL